MPSKFCSITNRCRPRILKPWGKAAWQTTALQSWPRRTLRALCLTSDDWGRPCERDFEKQTETWIFPPLPFFTCLLYQTRHGQQPVAEQVLRVLQFSARWDFFLLLLAFFFVVVFCFFGYVFCKIHFVHEVPLSRHTASIAWRARLPLLPLPCVLKCPIHVIPAIATSFFFFN